LNNIANDPSKVNEKFVARPRSFRYYNGSLRSTTIHNSLFRDRKQKN